MKTNKNTSLDQDNFDDIQQRTKKTGFVFSDWVNKEYRRQFLTLDTRYQEREELRKKMFDLDKEIAELELKNHIQEATLLRDEKRFLLSVPQLVSQGFLMKGLLARYNNEWHKNLSLVDFKNCIDHLKREEHAYQPRK